MPKETTTPTLPPGATNAPPPPEPPRSPKRGLEEFIGETTKPNPEPPPTSPPPPEPPKTPQDAQEPTKAADTPPKPTESPTANPDAKADASDIDSLLDVVSPQKQAQVQTKAEHVPLTDPKELRSVYAELKKEHSNLKAEVERIKSGKELSDMREAFEQLKADRDALAEKLAYAAYTESPEYENRFNKPTQEAFAHAIEVAGRIKNQLADRPGNSSDIQALYNLYQVDIAAATERAEEMFGKAGDRLLSKIEAFDQAEKARILAVEDWRKNAGTRKAQSEMEQQKARASLLETWKQSIEGERARRPELYDFSADPKLSDLHKRSEAFAEAAFLPPPDSDPQQVIQHQAKVRMLAGAAIPLMAKLRAAQEEIAQLKSTVSEYDGSKPKVKPTGEGSVKEKKYGLSALDSYFPNS